MDCLVILAGPVVLALCYLATLRGVNDDREDDDDDESGTPRITAR